MATTELTLGDRMAAAIDHQLASGKALEWDDDLSDNAFQQAYEELSRRGIDPANVERVLERTREVRNVYFGISILFGPPDSDHPIRREWNEGLRGRLVGYFAMCQMPAVPGTGVEGGAPGRVQFVDDTRTITVDGEPHQMPDSLMYRVWKVVYQHCPGTLDEDEIMEALGRSARISISKRREKLPPALEEMLIGIPGGGYEVRLPAPGQRRREERE
jgi:hypothetical protein